MKMETALLLGAFGLALLYIFSQTKNFLDGLIVTLSGVQFNSVDDFRVTFKIKNENSFPAYLTGVTIAGGILINDVKIGTIVIPIDDNIPPDGIIYPVGTINVSSSDLNASIIFEIINDRSFFTSAPKIEFSGVVQKGGISVPVRLKIA